MIFFVHWHKIKLNITNKIKTYMMLIPTILYSCVYDTKSLHKNEKGYI